MEIERLTLSIHGRVILNNVTAAFPGGRVTALVGANGAGKTTLLRCLSGDLSGFEGQVRYRGAPVDVSSDDWKRIIGVVPDRDAVFDELSPREQLSLAATLFGITDPSRTDRIGSLLEMFALDQRADAPASELSAGMRKRLAVAIALVHAPEVLLLDEPLNTMDVSSTARFISLLSFLKSTGRTVLLSGHVLPELLRAADDVIEIESGSVINRFDVPEGTGAAGAEAHRLKVFSRAASDEVDVPGTLSWLAR